MPPRNEIWDELARIRGHAMPAVVDPPQYKERNRTRKIFLKTTAIATAVIINASVLARNIVAPDERRYKVYAEINRPIFTHLSTPMNQIRKYITLLVLRETIANTGSMINYLKPEFIEDIAEECDLDQE